MSYYSDVASRAAKTIRRRGRKVILRRISYGGGDYDPATGVGQPIGIEGSVDTTRYVITADQPANRVAQQYGVTLASGTLVQNNDKWVFMDALGPKPALNDRVIFDNVDYAIIDSQETNPGGTAVLYLIVLRA